jgi:Uma2 family endonuclease
MTIPLSPGGHWTIEELALLPDDGNRYEIFDGSLLVTPPPDVTHALTTDRLTTYLKAHTPPHLETWSVGVGVSVRNGTTCYIPDIIVMAASAVRPGAALAASDVLLAVEVLSPGNKGRDLVLKRNDYATAGIPDYWIVDRDDRTVTALTLDPGASAYREQAVARAGVPWSATRPFRVTVDPGNFC